MDGGRSQRKGWCALIDSQAQDSQASDAYIIEVGGASVRMEKTNEPGVGTISLKSLRDQILMEIRAGRRRTISEEELDISIERFRQVMIRDAAEKRDGNR